ncbi:sensor histidine kinase [Gorillibacterium timonense]|uniref:sensor histidine kinase n=1 Tax=Gorillibacterium timonense TaxID=1689269 RepID=UPI00071C66E4|nr:sensor histidine kinase [Gorillibacterium timonense]
MSESTLLFFMSGCVLVLLVLLVYQQLALRKGTEAHLMDMCRKVNDILDRDSDEKVMVFTSNKALMELAAQINRLLEDRQKRKAEYRRFERTSKKMLSNISHDIKTPLTVILGYLEIIQLDSKEEEERLRKVEHKAKQVLDLLNEFFTLAKLDAEDMELAVSEVNLSEICRENLVGLYDILVQKNFQVEVSIPETEVPVYGNKDALHRILNNLLSNCIRYGSDGKYLGLFLRTDEAYAYLDVVDKGKGIEKAFADKVFERLYTMEDSRNRDIQGNGLGLTIAKQLAIRLGGELTLVSIPYEKTVFTVKLKRASGFFREMDRETDERNS